jgi:hypothetical protein
MLGGVFESRLSRWGGTGPAAAELIVSRYPWRTTAKRVQSVTHEMQKFMRLTTRINLYIVHNLEVAFYRDQMIQKVDSNHRNQIR